MMLDFFGNQQKIFGVLLSQSGLLTNKLNRPTPESPERTAGRFSRQSALFRASLLPA